MIYEVWFWILVVTLVVTGPMIWSASICVPKWYQKKVAPTKVGRGLTELNYKLTYAEPNQKLMTAVQYVFFALGLIVLSPLILVGAVVITWVDAWRIVISRACPYSTTVTDGPLIHSYKNVRRFLSKRGLFPYAG